jgi:hypothetical protein
MSIQEQKITEAAIAANGVQSRPDKLTGTAAQNKKVFDALVTAVVREKFNALLDELTGTTAAAQLGITTIPGFSAGNVQTALEQIVQAMQDVTQGSVTDGSITLAKLAAEVTAVALGGAAASHTHGAGDINSGILDAARLPVLDGTKLGAGSVGTAQLGAAVVTSEKLAALSVLATHIAQGAVTAQKIAQGAVTAEKIADNTVTLAKLASDAKYWNEVPRTNTSSDATSNYVVSSWGHVFNWVYGSNQSFMFDLSEFNRITDDFWETVIFANNPFTLILQNMPAVVESNKGTSSTAAEIRITVPQNKWIKLKKIPNVALIVTGNYDTHMIYTGTSETPPSEWQSGDFYAQIV